MFALSSFFQSETKLLLRNELREQQFQIVSFPFTKVEVHTFYSATHFLQPSVSKCTNVKKIRSAYLAVLSDVLTRHTSISFSSL